MVQWMEKNTLFKQDKKCFELFHFLKDESLTSTKKVHNGNKYTVLTGHTGLSKRVFNLAKTDLLAKVILNASALPSCRAMLIFTIFPLLRHKEKKNTNTQH